MFRLARSRKIVTRSPLDDLDPSERPKLKQGPAGRRLDEPELAAAVRHAADAYRPAIAVIAFTGCRISEALALTWDDVDLVELELHVRGQLSRATRQHPAVVIPRKANADPYVTIIFPALERVLTEHLRAELQAGRGRGDDFVLCNPITGRPLQQKDVSDAVSAAGLAAGLGKVTPHDFRRSVASLANRRGVDPVLGASMIGMTPAVYLATYADHYGRAQRD